MLSTKLRPNCDLAAYEALEARMDELIRQIPGYLEAQGYTGADGESLGLVLFDSRDALVRWRDHPEHLEAQRLGREQFYASYQIRVCSVERAYDFDVTREPRRSDDVSA